MKTTQPIKRHPSLVSFSKDHHFGLLLVWKIRHGIANGIEPPRIGSYVAYSFDQDLRIHFKEEEQGMFNKLPVEDPLRQQAEKEHALINELVRKIQEDPSNQPLLVEFANTLEAHIRFEERSLFNHLQDTLPAEDLAAISTYEGTQAGDIDARCADLFWLNPATGATQKK
jgi:hypothetical protein